MEKITNYLAFTVHRNKGVYALILGSGISRNAGIPTGWDITLDLISKLALLEDEKPVDELTWYQERFGEDPDYSNLLERLCKTSSERLNLLRSYFESDNEESVKTPSLAHKAIAKLIKKGYFKVVITTNFDRLLEQAMREEGIEPQVIRHSSDINGAIPLVHADNTVIKINGDYLDNRFLNTKSELEKYDSDLNNYVQSIFGDFGIISCGWSAKWDEGLVNILRTVSNHRYCSYWTHTSERYEDITALAQNRKGEVIRITNADEFFSELNEKIEALESLQLADPLSPQIALARVKKYLSKEEFVIQFDDLLTNEVKATRDIIDQHYNPSLYPNAEILRPIFTSFFNATARLVPLFIATANWLKPHHEQTILKSILEINKAPIFSSNYDESRYIRYFPCTVLMYATGIMALQRENYNFLHKIFSLKVYNPYDEREKISILVYCNPVLLEKDILNAIIQRRLPTPSSTYIREFLFPFFENIFVDDKNFKDAFDLFEYLLCLSYLFQIDDRHGREWAPWGEFAIRSGHLITSSSADSLIKDFNTRVNKEQYACPIFDEGFFGGFDTFIKTRSRYEEYMKDVRIR